MFNIAKLDYSRIDSIDHARLTLVGMFAICSEAADQT